LNPASITRDNVATYRYYDQQVETWWGGSIRLSWANSTKIE
jgi:hypothetical protein